MATAAIGTNLDAHWRVFQAEDKPLTPRGRSRLRGNRRTRARRGKHGRRFVALAKCTLQDISLGFIDFLDTEMEERNAREESRRLLDELYHLALDPIDDEFCERAHALPAIQQECERVSQDIASLEEALASASSPYEASEYHHKLIEKQAELELLHLDEEVLTLYAA